MHHTFYVFFGNQPSQGKGCNFCDEGLDHDSHMGSSQVSRIKPSVKILKIPKVACNLCTYETHKSLDVRFHQQARHFKDLVDCKVKKIGCKDCDENFIAKDLERKTAATNRGS